MRSSIKIASYILFGFGCIVFFAVILFPQKAVTLYVSAFVRQNAPGWTLTAENAGIRFPMGLKLERVRLFHLNRPMLEADAVVVSPHWLSLFTAKRRFDLNMKAHGGTLSATADVESPVQPERIRLTALFSEMEVGSIPALVNDLSIELSGKLGGEIELSPADNGQPELVAKLVLSDSEAVLTSKRLDQGRFWFDRIEADARVKNNRLQLSRCVFTGDQFSGSLKGRGAIKTPLEKTELFLRGTLHLKQLASERAAVRLRSQPKSPAEGSGLNFRIQGPADDLRFYL